MKIEFPDEIANRKDFDEKTLLEVLAVSLYKMEIINGVEGGKITGTSEMVFHGLLQKYGQYVNYDVDDLTEDIENLKDL
jgi:predicted HTH domain antitoxin